MERHKLHLVNLAPGGAGNQAACQGTVHGEGVLGSYSDTV